MKTSKRYSPEVRERAVRMVFEHQHEHDSQWATIESISAKIGCTAETLRRWVRQSEIDQGSRGGVSTSDRERLKELERKGVTKHLLWEEYTQSYPNRSYSYAQYCFLYQDWLKKQRRSMRQVHKAGDKLFVDYAGQTVPIVCGDSGEIRFAQVFVAVLGASNYTYCEATWTQGLPDWLASHARAFAFFGGVPRLIVPDNLKSGVTKACRYDPDINPAYQQLAAHYRCAIMPARPYKPKCFSGASVGQTLFGETIRSRVMFWGIQRGIQRTHTCWGLVSGTNCSEPERDKEVAAFCYLPITLNPAITVLKIHPDFIYVASYTLLRV